MNIQQAQQFLSIIKYMNMSKASKELYISQPALSLSINRLEEELGLKLFYREHNKLVLTPAGMALEEHFRKLIEDYDVLIQKASDLTRQQTKQILLGLSGSITLFSSFFITDFLNEVNGKVIRKVYTNNDLMMEMMNSGQIDFAITDFIPKDLNLSTLIITEDEIGIVASSGHPLAGKESLSFKDLKKQKFTGYGPLYSIRRISDELCAKGGFQPEYKKECNYIDFYQEIANNRGGDGLLSFFKKSNYDGMFGDGYVFIPLSEKDCIFPTVLCWLSDRKLEYEHADFINYLMENYNKIQEKHHKLNAMFMNV